MANNIIILICSLFVLGCGIKGDPKPPFKPAPIGRGKPSFSGSTKDLLKDINKKNKKKSEKKNEK